MSAEIAQNWLALSRYDIETAKAMLDAGRYLYVAFTCQQAVEKALKALYVLRRSATPPYTHNLLRLADELKHVITPDSSGFALLERLNSFYVESRYSEDYAELSRMVGRPEAESLYGKTLEMLEWLEHEMT